MLIAFHFLGLSWIWFQWGLWSALVLSAGSQLLAWKQPRLIQGLLLLGSAWIVISLESQLSHTLPRASQHSVETLVVCVQQSVLYVDEDYARFTGKVLTQPSHLNLRRLRVTFSPIKQSQVIQAGDCVKAEFRLKQPFGSLIPGTFNADRYFFSQKIDATARLLDLTEIDSEPSLSESIYLDKSVQFENPWALQVWSALVLGWSSSLDSELKQILSANQLMHLFVISGMHIGLMALGLVLFFKAIAWTTGPFLCISNKFRWMGICLCLLGFTLFIGAPVPAVRALIMIAIPFLLKMLAVRIHWRNSLSLSAIAIALLWPESWLSLGPWLSFSAVAIILAINSWQILSKRNRLVQLLAFQSIMSLTVLPWAFIFGFPVNLLSVPINLAAAPILVFVAAPLAVLILFFNHSFFVGLFDLVIDWGTSVLTQAVSFSTQLQYVPAMTLMGVIALIFLLVWGRSRWSIMVVLATPCLIIGSYNAWTVKTNGELKITIFDVGHGQSVLFETPEGNFLYDTGGVLFEETSLMETGIARVLPKLDGIVVSHSDQDHSAGLAYLVKNRPNTPIWAGQPQLLNIDARAKSCHKHLKLTNHMHFIPIPKVLRRNDNDESCILYYHKGGRSFLVTGDASKRIEYYLLQEHSSIFPVTAVMIGHHGSSTSSAKDWLELSQDSKFFVSSDDRASPKWPSEPIVTWFQEQGIKLYNTAELGSMQLKFEPVSVSVKSWDSAFRKRLIY